LQASYGGDAVVFAGTKVFVLDDCAKVHPMGDSTAGIYLFVVISCKYWLLLSSHMGLYKLEL